MELQRRIPEPCSDWSRKIFEGIAEGIAAGEAKWRAEGELFGQVKGRAGAILSLLEIRGFSVSTDVYERVTTCTDLALLGHWFRRAVKAQSVEEALTP